MGRSSRTAALVALVLLLSACPAPQERRETPAAPPAAPPLAKPAPATPPSTVPGPTTSPPPVAAAPSAPAPSAAAPAAIRTLDDYKRNVAAQILRANAKRTFEGRPPHFLNAIVVLEISLDASGQPTRVNVMRTPPHARHLGKVASDTVRSAAPFVAPPGHMLKNRTLVFTETWLFRDDEKFQIRSLALEQGG